MRNVKIVLYGVGAVGSMIAKSLIEKKGTEIVGVVDVAQDKVGSDLGLILGLRKKLGIKISDDVDNVLREGKPDVTVHATSSYLKDIYVQLTSIIEHGVDVVSTCEELSYPYVSEPKLASKLDALAKENEATVLGTGINPGFLMDTLVLTLTAPCQKIEEIQAFRVMNAAKRRVPFQKKIGAGLTVREFQGKIRKKQITGHVGLEQSIAMIAAALAWKLDKVVAEPVEPVIAKKTTESSDIRVKAGQVAGLRQKAKGLARNKEVIALDFQAYIGAQKEYDMVRIRGIPNITQKIQPCVHGDIGTVAMIVNSIPRVMKAPAGLLTMKDLPVPSAATEDIREYIKI